VVCGLWFVVKKEDSAIERERSVKEQGPQEKPAALE
jgi:hypothetical protein